MDTIKKGIKFILDNSQKVFTGIIVFMLIIFTFFQAFLRVVSDYLNFSESVQERIPLDLTIIKLDLLATMYDLVAGILICMFLLYFHYIALYLLQTKMGMQVDKGDSVQPPQSEKEPEEIEFTQEVMEEADYETFRKENEKYINRGKHGIPR